MSFINIKKLLKVTMGLSSDSVGDSSIERAVNHRKTVLKINDTDEYFQLISSDQDEMDELVEEVVVPETWFMRNIVPFELLVKCIPGAIERKKKTGLPLRILSLPCSTGEEPYSIAITLLNNGLKENEFHIDAQDISKRALRKARRAIFGKHSFREAHGFNIERYFRKTRSGLQLLPNVRSTVNFIRSNIVKNIVIPEPEYYDIIFCRNLLIYFDKSTQKKVLEKLHYMLKPGGTLFVGHAETSEIDIKYFTKLNKPKAFAYNKKNIGVNQDIKTKDNHTEELLKIYNNLIEITKKDLILSKNNKNKAKKLKPVLKKAKEKSNQNAWSKVENMIEMNRLNDASQLCEMELKQEPHNAQAYYYLAIVSKLEGGLGAAELLLKKAVYLDPNHHKAISLFCLLAEKRGDMKLAESLKRREIRVRNRINVL